MASFGRPFFVLTCCFPYLNRARWPSPPERALFSPGRFFLQGAFFSRAPFLQGDWREVRAGCRRRSWALASRRLPLTPMIKIDRSPDRTRDPRHAPDQSRGRRGADSLPNPRRDGPRITTLIAAKPAPLPRWPFRARFPESSAAFDVRPRSRRSAFRGSKIRRRPEGRVSSRRNHGVGGLKRHGPGGIRPGSAPELESAAVPKHRSPCAPSPPRPFGSMESADPVKAAEEEGARGRRGRAHVRRSLFLKPH
jgi:hypothetical protein